MTRTTLFRRFLARFLLGLAFAVFVFTGLFHLFQARVIDVEWREELRQEASWLARHTTVERADVLAKAWKTMHSAVRVTFFDEDSACVADSHPDRPPVDLERLRAGEEPPRQLAVLDDLAGGRGVLVMSRPYVPSFPSAMGWELFLALLLILGPIVLLLYPFARSMSTTLEELGRMARDVAQGQFGRALAVTRHDELGTLVESFNGMSAKLLEAERLSERLLHDVSHELRSPLGRIQVLAETIALRPDTRDACIRGIEQEVGLLDRLVEDLLQVARSEARVRDARFETFSLRHWAEETLARLEPGVRAAGVAWSAELAAEDCEVSGDAQHLTQALANLVDNALHALEGSAADGGGAIAVRLRVEPERWCVEVEDNGPGIPPEHLDYVFRRFYRVHEHRDRAAGGVGLGLSLVRATAEAHGGEARLEARESGGIRATLCVPRDAILRASPSPES